MMRRKFAATQQDISSARAYGLSGDFPCESVCTDAQEPDRPIRYPHVSGYQLFDVRVGPFEANEGRTAARPGFEHTPLSARQQPRIGEPCLARCRNLAAGLQQKSVKLRVQTRDR